MTVHGLEYSASKVSAVDATGRLRQDPIHDLCFRPTRPVPHEDGMLAEVAKTSWPEVDRPIVQVHITTTLAGRMRAWGLHQSSIDRLFVVSGLVSIVIYDGRLDSPTFQNVNEFRLSERNPGLLVIPPNLYHGWKNIGIDEAVIINMPTAEYNYENPDAKDIPYDSDDAMTTIPWRW